MFVIKVDDKIAHVLCVVITAKVEYINWTYIPCLSSAFALCHTANDLSSRAMHLASKNIDYRYLYSM